MSGGEPSEQWWLLWSFAVGLPLSVALLEAAVARVRGLSARALPAPPAHHGAEPRCRCCGAALPSGGALRRCGFCRTDNLVISGRYLRTERRIDRALDDMAKSFDQDLDARIDAGSTIAMYGGVSPFFLLFAGPVVGLIVPGQPRLWIVPGAMALLAGLLALWARIRRLPVEPLELLTLGQKVYVRGESQPQRVVCAQLMLPGGPVSLLGKTLDDVELAVRTSRGEGGVEIAIYRVKAATEPPQPVERGRLVAAEIWASDGEAAPRIHAVQAIDDGDAWRSYSASAGGDAAGTPQLVGHRRGDPPVIVLV